MKLNPGSRVKFKVDNVTTTWNPADTTVEVSIGGDWYPATWSGDAIRNLGQAKWTRDAETDDWFCGPDADPEGATVLEAGDHVTEVRLTNPSGQVVVFGTDTITVAD